MLTNSQTSPHIEEEIYNIFPNTKESIIDFCGIKISCYSAVLKDSDIITTPIVSFVSLENINELMTFVKFLKPAILQPFGENNQLGLISHFQTLPVKVFIEKEYKLYSKNEYDSCIVHSVITSEDFRKILLFLKENSMSIAEKDQANPVIFNAILDALKKV